MGGFTISDSATDCDPFVVDASARRLPAESALLDRTSALGAARIESVGPEPSHPGPPNYSIPEGLGESEVGLHQLWYQLPEGDRQRFGSCFSAMLLKAARHYC
jgi:hypothetical protein